MTAAPRPSKRALDDAIASLDAAVAGPAASTSAPQKRLRASSSTRCVGRLLAPT